MFQSTHPHGVRLLIILMATPALAVSIHAPARGATIEFVVSMGRYFCFNPRTRTGCDKGGRKMTKYQEVSIHAPARGATTGELPSLPCYGVSIHAPARGATYIPGIVLQLFDVSIHAPARGATSACLMAFSIGRRFNPRTRTGCDHSTGTCRRKLHAVSIHAPARGATCT